jgi:hypothetical protein
LAVDEGQGPCDGEGTIADEGLVAGPMGTMRIDPAKYAKIPEGQWTLKSLISRTLTSSFRTKTGDNAYTVHQTGDQKGRPWT